MTVLRFLAVACARLVLLVILHLALILFPSCCQAQMLGIIAGVDQTDSYVARFWPTWCSWSVAVHQGRRHLLRGSEAHPCGH